MNNEEYKCLLVYTEKQAVDKVRNIALASPSQKHFAKQCGISPQYLSDILKGNRPPCDSVLDKIGVKRVVIYVETEK